MPYRQGSHGRSIRCSLVAVASRGDVLLVEDDLDIAEILKIVLTRVGLEVHSARSLAEARQMLRSRSPEFAVVVVDKNLPDGNGLTVIEQERASGGDAEVVVITGFPSIDSAVHALRLGAYDYLEKPFRN